MNFVTVFLIALGLSFDSFAVSLCLGVTDSRITFGRAARVAFILALFQGLFPVIGFYLGYFVRSYIESVDHWLAFGLLGFIGLRMIISALRKDPDGRKNLNLSNYTVITMAVGTSIDALAVGISFAFVNSRIWASALIIGMVTFAASMTAIRIGKFAGPRLGARVELAGGLILIAIGVKILLEHTLLA